MSYDNFMLFQLVPVWPAIYSFSYHLTELGESEISLLQKEKMSKYLEVAKILAVRSIDGGKECRMRWKGFETGTTKTSERGFI